MEAALVDADLSADDVGYLNAHATSTPLGDIAELAAIRSVFAVADDVDCENSNDSTHNRRSSSSSSRRRTRASSSTTAPPLIVSSTKGSTGHMLGAAGAIEALITCLALQRSTVVPTANLSRLDESVAPHWTLRDASFSGNQSAALHVLGGVAPLALSTPMRAAMSNSFGFGGANCSLVFSRSS